MKRLLFTLVILAACEPTPTSTSTIESNHQEIVDYVAGRYSRADVHHTFTTKLGDVVDCVRIEAQPSLRGAKPNTPPSVVMHPIVPPGNGALPAELPVAMDECPPGFIPIKQVTVADVARSGTVEAYLGHAPATVLKRGNGFDQISQASWEPGKRVYQAAYSYTPLSNLGVSAFVFVWQPSVPDYSSGRPVHEFSGGIIRSVTNIWTGAETSVDVGVQEYPAHYGDHYPRLFISYTSDAYASTGCLNLDCTGFVQTGSICFGCAITSISHPDPAPKYFMQVQLYKSTTTGDWWMLYKNFWIGYYPKNLFTGTMVSNATAVLYGGTSLDEFYTSTYSGTSHGSGIFPNGNIAYDQANTAQVTTEAFTNMSGTSLSATVANANLTTHNDLACTTTTQTDLGAWNTPSTYYGGNGSCL